MQPQYDGPMKRVDYRRALAAYPPGKPLPDMLLKRIERLISRGSDRYLKLAVQMDLPHFSAKAAAELDRRHQEMKDRLKRMTPAELRELAACGTRAEARAAIAALRLLAPGK